MIECNECSEVKSESEYYIRENGYVRKVCKLCSQKQMKRRYHEKKANDPDFRKNENIRLTKLRKEQRVDIINHYGGKCACCGESYMEFLCIDHIDGGRYGTMSGSRHKKEIRKTTGKHFYTWLRHSGYPEGFRVLCNNCNQSMGAYGYCPHHKL